MKRGKRGREIHALELTVCEFVMSLYRLIHRVEGWDSFLPGINLKIEFFGPEESRAKQARVIVRPANWKRPSCICLECRQYHKQERWYVVKGSILARHISDDSLFFEVEEGRIRPLIIPERGESVFTPSLTHFLPTGMNG